MERVTPIALTPSLTSNFYWGHSTSALNYADEKWKKKCKPTSLLNSNLLYTSVFAVTVPDYVNM